MKGRIYYLKRFIIIIFILGIAVFMAFGRKKSATEIFNKDVYGQLVEIDYWLGDTKLVINNEKDIKSIYNKLSSLKLRKPWFIDGYKDGTLSLDLVMKNETMQIGLLSDEINVNGKKYYTDKDICDSILKIALKYMDYYNNDIFTKDLFENLIEIDCWVDNEKVAINDSDRMEEVYHYLSRLTLKEISPEYQVKREPMQIDFVSKDKTISFEILSYVLFGGDKVYYTDSNRDLIEYITSIATQDHQ